MVDKPNFLPDTYNTMFQWLGLNKSPMHIGFEDMCIARTHPQQYIIINTLPVNEQSCLIDGTIPASTEEQTVNEMLNQYAQKPIVIYGKHCADTSALKKQQQLSSLGFTHVYVYMGGLFEWLLLQDVYGATQFPTTQPMLDLLKYRPCKSL